MPHTTNPTPSCRSRPERPATQLTRGRFRPPGLRRPTSALRAALIALVATSFLGTANAQNTAATEADPPVVAIHYEDLLADESHYIDLFIPPPLVRWDEFSYSAEGCLNAQGVHEGPPGKVLIIRFSVPDVGPCVTRVDLLFGHGATSWAASAVVVVNRLPELPPLQTLDPWFRSDRINLPGGSGARPAVPLLLGLTNTETGPLEILGFGNDQAFVMSVGKVYRYDPAKFAGRYSDLVAHATPFEPTVLQPGESAHFAMILDPQQRMPTGAGTLTARPVAILELGGEQRTLQFPRISTAWGVELP